MTEQISSLAERINSAIGEDRYDEAYQLALELERIDADEASFFLGMCHAFDWGVDGDLSEAVSYFERCVKIGKNAASAAYFLSSIYYNADEYDDAISWGKKAIDLGEKDACLFIGNSYLGLDREADAIQWFEMLIENGNKDGYTLLGNCYTILDQPKKAIATYLKGIEAGADDNYFALGTQYSLIDDNENAVKYLSIAFEKGDDSAAAMLGTLCCKLANELRDYAAKQLNMAEYSQTNAGAIRYYLMSQQYFFHAIENNPSSMEMVQWIVLGRAAAMLYNLACRGELAVDAVDKATFSSFLSVSTKMTMASMDNEEHLKWWNRAMNVCAMMDNAGYEIVGEFFRAECCLTDCELHHSAEAYVRARWHLKRVGELKSVRGKHSVDDLTDLFSSLSDITDTAEKLGKKYDAAMQSLLAGGALPDLTLDYPVGKAPDPRSCKGFMKLNHAGSHTSASAGSGDSPIKKLFGLFGKRG